VSGEPFFWCKIPIPQTCVSRFEEPVSIQNRLSIRYAVDCQGLPDQRQGRNTTYAMADFAFGAFASFFMQSPSFLAHQRHLEVITHLGKSHPSA
jgi:hypothetical protein